MSILNKVVVLSVSLGALAVLVTLLYLFPFWTGAVLAGLGFIGWLVVNSFPTVKKTDSHTITIKRG